MYPLAWFAGAHKDYGCSLKFTAPALQASPSLAGILDNYQIGLTYLRETFGAKPRCAFQIDSFGHSAVTPALYGALG